MPDKTIQIIAEVPYMAEQWDFAKNTDDINVTKANLREPRYWRCKKCGYEWESSPRARLRSSGQCPCCESGKVIKKGINDIFTIVPELMEFYDFEKNSDLDIYSEGINSTKIANWKCKECGREWQTSILARVKKENGKYTAVGCPHFNTVKRKKDEVPVVADIPDLIKFWDYHNNTQDPKLTLSNSPECVSWVCNKCGYKWTASINSRANATGKCSCCELHLVHREGHSDIFTLIPEIVDSYDFEKNKDIDIYSLGVRSTLPLWWKCPDCGYEWQTSIASRIEGKEGKYVLRRCQQCYIHNADRITPVASQPDLLQFWDFKKNKGMDANLTSAFSTVVANWKCKKCGYEWQGTIKGRHDANGKCPCCDSGTAIQKGVNDVVTLVPDIVNLYDFEKNAGLDIYSFGLWSKKEVFWKCPICGNEWSGPIYCRIRKETDGTFTLIKCPACSNNKYRKQTYAEQYPELNEVFNEELNGCTLATVQSKDSNTVKFWWNCQTCGNTFPSRLQSMIVALNTSTKGCPYCARTKILPGSSFADIHPDLMEEYDPTNIVDAFEEFPTSKKSVKWVCRNNPEHKWEVTFAVRHYGSGTCPICNRTRKIEGINTFADVYPELVSMWSLNNERSVYDVFYNSSMWFKWICPTCKSEFGAYIEDVISDEEACPYCSNRMVLPGFNSLQTIHPDIASQWSPNNELTADQVLATAGIWSKWICPDCGGEYSARIREMVSGEASCPYCNDRMVLPGFNSFAAKHPDLLEEWDYVANYMLADPDQISDTSVISLWWNCPHDSDHVYSMTPKQRLMFQKRHKEPCPYCKGLRRKKRHFV